MWPVPWPSANASGLCRFAKSISEILRRNKEKATSGSSRFSRVSSVTPVEANTPADGNGNKVLLGHEEFSQAMGHRKSDAIVADDAEDHSKQ
jgi:hypothetical protein